MRDFAFNEKRGLEWYTFSPLDELGFFKHWITTRKEGLSLNGFGGLNLAHRVGDDPKAVIENRHVVRSHFCLGKHIYFPKQVHGSNVIEVGSADDESCEADALMVAKPGVPIGILTADCLPIILADPVKKRAALVHAGRMGIFKSVLSSTVTAMIKSYETDPKNLVAGIGPALRECCYEVGDEIFNGGFDSFKKYLKSGKLDMITAAKDQLLKEGLSPEKIYDSEFCTSCKNRMFFSHRKQNGKAGRFMTGLFIE